MNLTERKQAWWDWHKANPEVWRLFEKFSLQAIDKGHKRLSAWLIVNRIRWETMVITTGKDFKISNDYIAWYSRYFIMKYPQYRDFFAIKRMKGETVIKPKKMDSIFYQNLISNAKQYDYYASKSTGEQKEIFERKAKELRQRAEEMPDDYVDPKFQMPSWGTHGN